MRKPSWQYAFRVQFVANPLSEPFMYTDNEKKARLVCEQQAKFFPGKTVGVYHQDGRGWVYSIREPKNAK